MQLDADQKKAVETTEGAVCIVAGPGSGKTFTLVERIAYLIEEKQVSPQSVLAITFTNKAAGELRARTELRCPGKRVSVHTFHSLALALLRQSGREVDIATEREQKEIVKELVKQFPDCKSRDVGLLISREKEKNALEGCERSPLLEAYDAALKELSKVDFDDLLCDAYQLFVDGSVPVYEYIMVDEYQDTNLLQAKLLEKLNSNNICIIGDPDQAIYGFRGAHRENFFDFQKQYENVETIELRNNYRSQPHIVTASRALMIDVTHRSLDASGKVQHIILENALEEAKYIVKSVRSMTGGLDMNEATSGSYHLGDISVLYRTNTVGDLIEKQFASANIPYYRVGAKNFFDYPEIHEIIERLKMHGHQAPLVEQIKLICNALGLGRHEDVSKKGKEQNTRIESLKQRAQSYHHLAPDEAREQFLYEAELSRAEDDSPIRDAVSLMTAHAAKGLEFPVVLVAGVEEGLFPHEPASASLRRGRRNGTDVEEEKRLLYVAMTRAKEDLYLLTSEKRFRFGTEETTKPSRFLKKLPNEVMHQETIKRHKKEKSPQAKLF